MTQNNEKSAKFSNNLLVYAVIISLSAVLFRIISAFSPNHKDISNDPMFADIHGKVFELRQNVGLFPELKRDSYYLKAFPYPDADCIIDSGTHFRVDRIDLFQEPSKAPYLKILIRFEGCGNKFFENEPEVQVDAAHLCDPNYDFAAFQAKKNLLFDPDICTKVSLSPMEKNSL